MSNQRDLRSVATAAAILAALALAIPIEWLSLMLLAPLAFFLSGYAIAAAAFVDSPPPPTRLATISVALSLAVLALLPLPLNYLGGLTPATWALALVLVVLVGCGVAAYRRRGTEPTALALPRPPALSPLSLACGLGALVAVVAALVLAFVPLSNSDAVGFTELSIRPVAVPGGAAVRVGVGSEEQGTTVYRLQVRFGGGGAPAIRRIQLAPGESSVLQLLASPQPRAGRPTRVAAALYRAGEPKRPYRRVYGWIPAIIGR